MKSAKNQTNGFIWGHIEEIRKQISGEKFEIFSNLPSDDARVQFISNFSPSFPSAEASPSSKKDVQRAMNLKNSGNQSFQNSNWEEALEFYNKSLIHMPKTDGKRTKIIFLV
jgi:hypothetical protein